MKSLILIGLALFANVTFAEMVTPTALDLNNASNGSYACVNVDVGSAAMLRQLADSIRATLHVDAEIPAQTLGQLATSLKTCIELANRYHTPSGQKFHVGAIYVSAYNLNKNNGDINITDRGIYLFINPSIKKPLDLQSCYNELMAEGYFN
jgi:hypothetical protein